MGNLIFLILHIIALVFFAWGLLLTIPLHLIYEAMLSGRSNEKKPTSKTHGTCPNCKELVFKDARVCKHCGCKLIPLSEQEKASWWP